MDKLSEVLRAEYNENYEVNKYLKIRRAIRHVIDSGLVKENEMLPTENELCHIFNVSRMTVRQAIDELVREGYLERQSGSGTFVKSLKLTGRLRTINSFSDEIALMGKVAKHKLIHTKVMRPSPEVVAKLQLDDDMKALQIKRVRFVDEVPSAYQVSYLPYPLCAGLLQEDLDQRSLYDVLQEKGRFTFTRGIERVQALEMPKNVASWLDCFPGSACFFLSRVIYVKEYQHPIEYVETFLRGDKFIFSHDLTN